MKTSHFLPFIPSGLCLTSLCALEARDPASVFALGEALPFLSQRKIQGERGLRGRQWPFLICLLFTSDLYNCKTSNPSFSGKKKSQALTFLLEFVLFSHYLTRSDCQQLLMTLLTSVDLKQGAEAKKAFCPWLRVLMEAERLHNFEEAFPSKCPDWDLNMHRVKGLGKEQPGPDLTPRPGTRQRTPPIPELAPETDHKNPLIPSHPGKLCHLPFPYKPCILFSFHAFS